MALCYGFCLGDITSVYDSAQFSHAFHAVFGDGTAPYGMEFSMTNSGFSINAGTGFAYAGGRWLHNNNICKLTVPPADSHRDRYDALAVCADYKARKTKLEIIPDIDRDAVLADPVILRNEQEYILVLYFIHVRRGATTLSPNDITDVRDNPLLCGTITTLREASDDILYIYRKFMLWLPAEEWRLLNLGDMLIQKAGFSLETIAAKLDDLGLQPHVGDLRTSLKQPLPAEEWLLCDGSEIPLLYQNLRNLIGDHLPDIPGTPPVVKTYIYSGNHETNYLVTQSGDAILFGGIRILIE